MDPASLFHVLLSLPHFGVWGCLNEAQDRYAEAVGLGGFVWRTFVKMSSHCGIIIMMNVVKMTVELDVAFRHPCSTMNDW